MVQLMKIQHLKEYPLAPSNLSPSFQSQSILTFKHVLIFCYSLSYSKWFNLSTRTLNCSNFGIIFSTQGAHVVEDS